jgi:hypothetical protein
MTRFSILLAVSAIAISSVGCGSCCPWLNRSQPVVSAPACAPAPACDPCAPVTYGTAPTTPMYSAPPQW